MGVAVYISLEKPLANIDHVRSVDGNAIAKSWEALIDLADQNQIDSLDKFLGVSRDDLVDLIGEDELLASGVEATDGQWFDAEMGLKAVCALLDVLNHHPKGIPKIENVIDDLKSYERVLRAVHQESVRFRLTFDF